MAVFRWHHPTIQYHDTNNYSVLAQKSQAEQQAYADFLASLGTTPQDQQAAFAQVLPQAEIQSEVAAKSWTLPKLLNSQKFLDSQIKTSSATGKTAVANYMAQASTLFEQLQSVTDSGASDIYNPNGDVNKINSMVADAKSALASYQKITVPKEAVDFHKQLIAGLETYIDLFKQF